MTHNIEELEATIITLKIQLKQEKKIEEAIICQLDEHQENYEKLEAEVVFLEMELK